MLAHGYQGSLLGVRAVQEEFSLVATGFMLSGYYVGYFIGAKIIPNFILRVGHIKSFCSFCFNFINSNFNAFNFYSSINVVYFKSNHWN